MVWEQIYIFSCVVRIGTKEFCMCNKLDKHCEIVGLGICYCTAQLFTRFQCEDIFGGRKYIVRDCFWLDLWYIALNENVSSFVSFDVSEFD